MSARSATLVVLVTVLGSGCAPTRGPSHYLQPAAVTQREAHGGWITLQLRDRSIVDGELVAVHTDTVFMLPLSDSLRAVPRDAVARVVFGAYDSGWGGLAAWTAIGSLATISHGWFLALSFPVWVIAGSITTGAASRAPIIRAEHGDAHTWTRIMMFARFPAGLPEGLDRAALRGRHTTRGQPAR